MNETISETPAGAITKRDLVTRGPEVLDRERVGTVMVSDAAGGLSFTSMLEVMEFAKLVSTAGLGIPKDFRGNVGLCLAITMQAVEWRMSPIAVINKCYAVNDRIGYESQLIHAVVESRAPIMARLRCSYDGVGATRTCKVWATFIGEDEPHDYESPTLGNIKVKNSPLWVADPDQQLFYYASRAWARKWCPDVIMGVYTRDELQDSPRLGRDDEPAPLGLTDRLAAAAKTDEGFRDGHADRELSNIAAGGGQIIDAEPVQETGPAAPASDAQAQPQPAGDTKAPLPNTRTGKRLAAAAKAKDATKAKGDAPPASDGKTLDQSGPPADSASIKTADQYVDYAKRWIDDSKTHKAGSARWAAEKDMRDRVAVPVKTRTSLQNRLDDRFAG